ncbi:MAG TPA: hypothetical protein VFU21_31435 [Kofleriaceae bacterium]|nr:hypothetical protein [Kofleriaceae bacterium]
MSSRLVGLAFLAVQLGPATACHKAWRADTLTPPITFGANLDARTSLPAVIELHDMELPRSLALMNSAYFVAVSRDRLRFHVTLHHKWEDMSDPTRWRVWIEDDRGRVYHPAACDRRVIRPVTRMYDARRMQPFLSFTVYKGDGDYVFYRHNLVRKDMRWLTLIMKRPGYEYRYRWSFVESVLPAEAAPPPPV